MPFKVNFAAYSEILATLVMLEKYNYRLLQCCFGLSHSFIYIFSISYHCVYGCIFCILLFNFVNYVFYFYVCVF